MSGCAFGFWREPQDRPLAQPVHAKFNKFSFLLREFLVPLCKCRVSRSSKTDADHVSKTKRLPSELNRRILGVSDPQRHPIPLNSDHFAEVRIEDGSPGFDVNSDGGQTGRAVI